MTLTLVGPQKIEDMMRWAKESFSGVKNKNLKLPDLGDPFPWPKEAN